MTTSEGGAGRLPGPLRRHVERALVSGGPVPRQVRITQRGEMLLKPGARARRFTATQRFAVEHVAFSWNAHFPLLGPIAFDVVDVYADGAGALELRLLGLPLQRQHGAATSAGEALRYLAELPFVPHAMVHNRKLEWEELDELTVVVAARIRGERLTVELKVDDNGDIVRTSSRDRRRKVGGEWLRTPWGGRFGEYESFDGVRLPTSAEAYWDLPQDRYVYWRGTVLSAGLLHEPFAGSLL